MSNRKIKIIISILLIFQITGVAFGLSLILNGDNSVWAWSILLGNVVFALINLHTLMEI